MPLVVYIASVVGAVALMLALPKRRYTMPKVGLVLGAATLGAAWLLLATSDFANAYGWPGADGGWGRMVYYYLFSAIAILAAARVITHTKPVYSALYFVLVVLASAGLFLLLSAEFMAFAVVIIYGGAILVTYMFVIMLATSSEGAERPAEGAIAGGEAEHDRVAREPVAATAAGFLLLAALLNVFVQPGVEPNAAAAMAPDAELIADVLPERTVNQVAEIVAAEARERGVAAAADTTEPAEAQQLFNAERVGLDLFLSHPLGLELAGVILLVALVGAIVIARTQIPDEDGVRTHAPPDPATGATVNPTHEAGPHEREGVGRIGGRMGP